MSQATTWSVPLSGPATPTLMATRMDDSLDALLSSHSGSTRPTYAVAGTIWISTATAGKLKRYLFDGTNDRLIETIDIATGAITYEGGTMAGAVNYAGFALQNPLISGIPGGALLQGFLYGLTLSNNATDATNDIDIAVGSAASDGATPYFMTLASALTKRLDAAWAVGSGNGGLDTGSIANTTYHVWLIQRSDTGVVDALFSTSATSPTMPTNYDRKRRIGSILRVSAAIVGFTQNGDDFYLGANLVVDRNSASAATNALVTLSVPTGIRVSPWLSDAIAANASSNILTFVGNGDIATADIRINQTSTQAVGVISRGLVTNTSAQVRFTQQNASGTAALHTTTTFGWTDTRGRI